jgi:hypothetical protein
MSVSSTEQLGPIDSIQEQDSSRSWDDGSNSESECDSILDHCEPLLDWNQGNAIVTLNSILHANNELSGESCFDIDHIAIKAINTQRKKFIGSNGDNEGFITERKFTKVFRKLGYIVTRSSLQEMMRNRDDGDSFLLQGIAQRKCAEDCKKAINSRAGIQYLQGEDNCEEECDDLWLHCLHVLPILDCFYCSQQREFSGDMKGDVVVSSFSWLCLSEDGSLKSRSYMKKITDVWRITRKKGSLLKQVKRKWENRQLNDT